MSKTGTYKLYGGKCDSVLVTLNQYGHVTYCDDSEQLYGAPSQHEPHRSDKAQFFDYNQNGIRVANAKFFANAQKLAY